MSFNATVCSAEYSFRNLMLSLFYDLTENLTKILTQRSLFDKLIVPIIYGINFFLIPDK